jgi:hypothetical protein
MVLLVMHLDAMSSAGSFPPGVCNSLSQCAWDEGTFVAVVALVIVGTLMICGTGICNPSDTEKGTTGRP